MANPNSPNSIITQVTKEDPKNGSTKLLKTEDNVQVTAPEPYNASTQNNNSGKTVAIEVEDTNNNNRSTRPWSFWDYICCRCCTRAPGTSGAAYRKDNLDLQENYLLAPLAPDMKNKKTLVLDLDETLVHSSFKPIANPDFIIPVEIEEQIHKVYVVKRPHVDNFMQRLGPQFEVVVFTASLAKYADPVLDLLDIHKVVKARLFREACSNYKGNYVKDLNRLGRELNNVIIIDNSPPSYLFHPENAVPIESWFDDENDTELLDLIPFLESLTKVDNVRTAIEQAKIRNGKSASVSIM